MATMIGSPLPPNRSGFIATGALEHEDVISEALAQVKDYLWFRWRMVHTDHSERYVRQLLAGERPMPLSFFFAALSAVFRLGERQERGRGREWVRRILSILARPFGLAVIVAEERDPKDPRSEILEANEAISRAFVTTHDAIADAQVSKSELDDVERAVAAARAELDDVAAATARAAAGER